MAKKKNSKEVIAKEHVAAENEMTEANQAESDTLEQHELHVHDYRRHVEALGRQWAVLVGNPKALMPQILGTIIHSGGTRPCWQRKTANSECMLMAWPEDQPLRAAAVLKGTSEADLKPASAMPLLEGYPNDFEVHSVVPWQSDVEANVGVTVLEGDRPLWFYDPLYFRDKEDLTPGVTHTFLLSGLALGIRRALLDEMTITQGPLYESHASAWLEQNPDKKRLDVPPLKLNLAGKQIIMPGREFCEYEVRSTVSDVQTCMLDKLEITMLRLGFPMPDRDPVFILVYVPTTMLKDYTPKAGDEVDAYIWLQARIADV